MLQTYITNTKIILKLWRFKPELGIEVELLFFSSEKTQITLCFFGTLLQIKKHK